MFLCIGKKASHRRMALILRGSVALGRVGRQAAENSIAVQSYEWGLHFEQDARMPVPNRPDSEINQYRAYFHGPRDKKIIYLTFDAGYENGYTRQILDVLKKHNVPAAFFLVGPYIKEHRELVKRMAAEGHTVGNHSYNHPDMRTKSKSDFLKELSDTRRVYKEVTGQDMQKFYRPPEGKFTTENLKWRSEAGYVTVLWGSAYVDWNVDDQPSDEYAFGKIASRTFDGTVFLLHSTSQTNARILDRQLTKWENEGYTFGDIRQLESDLGVG